MVTEIVSVSSTMRKARWPRPRVCKKTVHAQVKLDTKAPQELGRSWTGDVLGTEAHEGVDLAF